MGYLVPEFPGQTHIFFRREIDSLERFGINSLIISTQLPPPALMSHSWSEEARQSTIYLFPPSPVELLGAFWELLSNGPSAWKRILRVIFSCDHPVQAAKFILPAAQLRRICHRRGIEHLHVHSSANAAHLALLCRQLGGPSYSITLHGPLDDYGPNQRVKWEHASFGVAITRQLKSEIAELLGHDIGSKTHVAPMGVDVDRFQRSTPFAPWDGISPLRLFCCARLNPSKGYEDLIQAVLLLRESGIAVSLRIAGEDDRGGTGYRQVLEERITESEAAESIHLLGAMSEEAIIQELHSAHLFVLASHREPLGVAIMEAMAASLPVISTNAGGVPELIDHEMDGILVPPQSPEKLADAIHQLAHSPHLTKKLSENAVGKVSRKFHSDVSATVLRDILWNTRRIKESSPSLDQQRGKLPSAIP